MPVVSNLASGIKVTIGGVEKTVERVFVGTNRVFGNAPATPINATLREFEAEDGTIVDMTEVTDAGSSGGAHVLVDTASTGSVTFSLSNMQAGDYVLEILGDFPSTSENAIDIEVNSSSIGTFAPTVTDGIEWRAWDTRITLTEGTNELVLNGNEANVILDKVRVTYEEDAPPDEPDPPTGSRIAFEWPGHATNCPFNLPMNDGATFEADSADSSLIFINELGSTWLPFGNSVNVYQTTVNDPIATLTPNEAGFSAVSIRLPAAAQLAIAPYWVILQPNATTAYHIKLPVRDSDTSYRCSLYREKDITGSMLPADLSGFAGSYDTGFSEMSGVLRAWEMNDPDLPIRHSLALDMAGKFIVDGFVWPAAAEPGWLDIFGYPTGGPGPFQIGDLIAIPQTIDLPTVTASWNRYATKVANALQRFGAYIVASNKDGTNHGFMADQSVSATAAAGYNQFSAEIINMCRRVSNASESNPKGTGSAIYTGAPSL